MRDANEESLNAYMGEIEKREIEYESFMDDVEVLLIKIDINITQIKDIANGYNIELDDEIRDLILEML